MENCSDTCPVSYVFWRITYANTTSILRSNRTDARHRTTGNQHGYARGMVTSRELDSHSRVFLFRIFFTLYNERKTLCLFNTQSKKMAALTYRWIS